MYKLLIVKSLFCPNETYLKKNFDTFEKINDFFRESEIEIDVMLIGWMPMYRKEIGDFLKNKSNFKEIFINAWQYNLGKYQLFNSVKQFLSNDKKYDYLIYMDHDVYFPETKSPDFHEIFNLIGLEINCKKIGLILFNQLEDCRHQNDAYQNKFTINDINICLPDTLASVACGCFVTSQNIFVGLDDFDLVSIYGLDDLALTEKICQKDMVTILLPDIYVVHPFFKNDRYDAWKLSTVSEMIENKKINYFDILQTSKSLWIQ